MKVTCNDIHQKTPKEIVGFHVYNQCAKLINCIYLHHCFVKIAPYSSEQKTQM